MSREDTITVANDYGGWAKRLDEARALGDVVYGRTVRDSDGRTWLQFWFFYAFNNSLPALGDSIAGSAGDHEGDWEVVQIKLDAAGQAPELVVYSQHKGAQAVAWQLVESVDGHPVVYPGRGTHAGMFGSGCHWSDTGAWRDCNDREGREVTPAFRLMDEPWAMWRGRFGTIAAPCTTAHWKDPLKLIP